MRIFLAGDHYSGTGPANVTKYYIDNLPEGTLYQKRRSKPLRAAEIVLNTLRADVAVYSGYSKQNLLGMRLAKMFHRPCAYIMHGCVEYENEINREPDEEMTRVERTVLEMSDLVICVSESFCRWAKDFYPMYAGKFVHVTNGIDPPAGRKSAAASGRDRHMILSVGGGMPRKKIINICRAVEKLRQDYDPGLYVCVIGAAGADSDAIDAFDLTDDRGIVPFEEACALFDRAALFVQNSCFETFALAPLEALSRGCSVLCSRAAGALCLINDLRDEDVIENCEDIVEIADKIKKNLEDPNAGRLSESIDWERGSWKERSRQLAQVLSELVLKR